LTPHEEEKLVKTSFCEQKFLKLIIVQF
jgi:hypothetical protein